MRFWLGIAAAVGLSAPLCVLAAPIKHSAEGPNWRYTIKTSALGVVTKTACTLSLNSVHLNFPYKTTKARLCVRPPVLHDHGLEVFIELVGDGQIVTDEGVQTKFDDEVPGGYAGYGSDDGSSDTIWLGDTYDALVEIRHAKKSVMELTFYRNGTQALIFNTAGLVLPEIGECDRDPAFAGFDKDTPSPHAWCQNVKPAEPAPGQN